jgi:hypothetical protein
MDTFQNQTERYWSGIPPTLPRLRRTNLKRKQMPTTPNGIPSQTRYQTKTKPKTLFKRLQKKSQASKRISSTMLDMQRRIQTKRPIHSRPLLPRHTRLTTITSTQVLQLKTRQQPPYRITPEWAKISAHTATKYPEPKLVHISEVELFFE